MDKIYHWSIIRLSDSKSKSDPKEVRGSDPRLDGERGPPSSGHPRTMGMSWHHGADIWGSHLGLILPYSIRWVYQSAWAV